jgi:hypothetical protein
VVQKLTLLSSDRLKNIQIILGRLKMDPEDIKNFLYSLEFNKKVKSNQVHSLLSILPNTEEIKALQ